MTASSGKKSIVPYWMWSWMPQSGHARQVSSLRWDLWGISSAAREREVPARVWRSLNAVFLVWMSPAVLMNLAEINAFLKFTYFDCCKNISVCVILFVVSIIAITQQWKAILLSPTPFFQFLNFTLSNWRVPAFCCPFCLCLVIRILKAPSV